MPHEISSFDTARDKDKFWLCLDVEIALLFDETVQTDLLTLSILGFFDIGLRTFEEDHTLCLCRLDLAFVSIKSKKYIELP